MDIIVRRCTYPREGQELANLDVMIDNKYHISNISINGFEKGEQYKYVVVYPSTDIAKKFMLSVTESEQKDVDAKIIAHYRRRIREQFASII